MLALALALALGAQAELGVVELPVWGDFADDDNSWRVLAPHSRVDVWSILCEQGPVDPQTGAAPFSCKANARLPSLPDATESPNATHGAPFKSANEELARMQKCFDVRFPAPPSDVMQAAASATHVEGALAAAHAAKTPTVLVIAWAYAFGHERIYETFARIANEKGDGFVLLAVPPAAPVDATAAVVLDVPGARDVLSLVEKRKHRAALTRASAALADALKTPRDWAPTEIAALRSNVALAAILDGNKTALPDAAFDDSAHASEVGPIMSYAARWARGRAWLGAIDPCTGSEWRPRDDVREHNPGAPRSKRSDAR